MTRNLKALGLALLAAFALSALSASAASAETDHFTAAEDTALLTGVGHDHVFVSSGSKFECTTSKFAATVNNGDTETTVDVEYEGTLGQNEHPEKQHCNSSTGTVTIDMNSCGYILTGDTSQDDPTGPEGPDAVVWIECDEEGDSIDITSSFGITISVPAQTPTKGGVTYKPEGGKVKVTATATGITATCAGAFLCGLAGIPTHSNESTYNGTVLMTGYEDNNPTPGVITPAEEGPEIDIGIESTR